MKNKKLYQMPFSEIYPFYLAKAEKKQRTKKEVDQIICWLTGYTEASLNVQLNRKVDVETFFNDAPDFNVSSSLITGVICGVRIEDITDPLMKKIRCLDKLIDELAKGRSLDKILRK